MQKRRIVVGDIDSFMLNREIFSRLDREFRNDKMVGRSSREPVGCKGWV